jgi:hypothetical protein
MRPTAPLPVMMKSAAKGLAQSGSRGKSAIRLCSRQRIESVEILGHVGFVRSSERVELIDESPHLIQNSIEQIPVAAAFGRILLKHAAHPG